MRALPPGSGNGFAGVPRILRGLAIALFLALATGLAAPADSSVATRPAAADTSAKVAVFTTTQGPIVIRLFPRDAPKTVANFVALVSKGFYDSLTFHRVHPGFVIQGGDPNSRDANPFNDGQGGPGYTVPAEIGRKHVKGAVAMARMPDVVNPKRESNGSQFYIALRDLPQLDGGYTVFGQVIAGWDAIDKLVTLAARTDIARNGQDANPGALAMILRARMEPYARWAAKSATTK